MSKGYSLGAMADLLYPCNYTDLGATNLNTLFGDNAVGVYRQRNDANATPAKNYPVALSGCLEVLPASTESISVQRYTTHQGGDVYIRTGSSATPGPWKLLVTATNIYNAVYPIGISILFASNVNPNTAFPGTTWTQVVDGRQIRSAGNDAAIGTSGGSDTATLAVGNLPQHTHTAPMHNHQLMHHTHGLDHSHSATIANSVGHRHMVVSPTRAPDNQGGAMTVTAGNYVSSLYHLSEVSTDYYAYSMQGTHIEASAGLSSYDGVHAHTISIDAQNGQTTGTSAAVVTSAGGGETGGGSGTSTPINTAGLWRKYGIWTRTA